MPNKTSANEGLNHSQNISSHKEAFHSLMLSLCFKIFEYLGILGSIKASRHAPLDKFIFLILLI